MLRLASFTALSAAALAAATPAERAIEQARAAIQKNPGEADRHSTLALALARRARETADGAFYDQGEEQVRKALAIAPDNFAALKARAWILLGKHEFAQARELAQALNKRMPDDVIVYGFLVDANVELGNYAEAEKAANWMLRLRPGNIPALTRAAYLRELFGDLEGAADLMVRAYQSTRIEETEDRAWLLVQVGHLALASGNAAKAVATLEQALALFPDYHYALAGLAKAKSAKAEFAAAAELMKRRYAAAPHPENLFDLAEALSKAGRTEEAEKAFAEFEQKALAESKGWDNANRELVFYYADHARKPADALRIAEMEYGRRKDVFTRDAYGWALHRNGRTAEAREQYEAIRAVGLRDAKALAHAAAVEGAAQ